MLLYHPFNCGIWMQSSEQYDIRMYQNVQRNHRDHYSYNQMFVGIESKTKFKKNKCNKNTAKIKPTTTILVSIVCLNLSLLFNAFANVYAKIRRWKCENIVIKIGLLITSNAIKFRVCAVFIARINWCRVYVMQFHDISQRRKNGFYSQLKHNAYIGAHSETTRNLINAFDVLELPNFQSQVLISCIQYYLSNPCTKIEIYFFVFLCFSLANNVFICVY